MLRTPRLTGPSLSAAVLLPLSALGTPAALTAQSIQTLQTGDTVRTAPSATEATAPADSTAPQGRGPRTLQAIRVTERAARRAGYASPRTTTAMRTDTPLRDTPQAVTVVTRQLIADQAMRGMQDVVRYVPGITMGQGEGHRDAPTIRGNSTTADFYVDGVRDDVQYFRDLYNVERVEALKGSNAMIFGRGGGGGVINRVMKNAEWTPVRALSVDGGSFDQRRAALDVGQGVGLRSAVRLNAMYENSDVFRDAVGFRRWGINPTATFAPTGRTTVRVGYERFDDYRTVDRGIPSADGQPSDSRISAFFGNPTASWSQARVNLASAAVEHAAGAHVTIRNRTQFGAYDKYYQNVYPSSAVDTLGAVSLGAYNNGTGRQNLFNQTDVTVDVRTGRVRHALLVGAELGQQRTDNRRETGYFGAAATSASMKVPFATPTTAAPVAFRQSASDADNHVDLTVASAYLQDQVTLSPQWQLVGGLRVERFGLRFRDNGAGALRAGGTTLRRDDTMLSPRAGLVFKPVEAVSLYGSSSVSFLPSSGDQFASLTPTSQSLRPERFHNAELGAKWDVRPNLALTAAVFRLDRSNTTARDPNDPTRTLLTGSQRTAGWEVGATGALASRWEVAGGIASQDAEVTSATTAAPLGATPGLVPHTTFSLWNKVRVAPVLSAGLGVLHQSRMYASIDNTVTLPGFTRVDAALFLKLTPALRAQLNVENLLDRRYFATSHGNNNIMPGTPRMLRLTLVTGR